VELLRDVVHGVEDDNSSAVPMLSTALAHEKHQFVHDHGRHPYLNDAGRPPYVADTSRDPGMTELEG
jgi:hypothetical protein